MEVEITKPQIQSNIWIFGSGQPQIQNVELYTPHLRQFVPSEGKLLMSMLFENSKGKASKKDKDKEEVKSGDEAARMWPTTRQGTQGSPYVNGSGGKVPKRRTSND